MATLSGGRRCRRHNALPSMGRAVPGPDCTHRLGRSAGARPLRPGPRPPVALRRQTPPSALECLPGATCPAGRHCGDGRARANPTSVPSRSTGPGPGCVAAAASGQKACKPRPGSCAASRPQALPGHELRPHVTSGSHGVPLRTGPHGRLERGLPALRSAEHTFLCPPPRGETLHVSPGRSPCGPGTRPRQL